MAGREQYVQNEWTDYELTDFAATCRGHRTISVTFWKQGEIKLGLNLRLSIWNLWVVIDKGLRLPHSILTWVHSCLSKSQFIPAFKPKSCAVFLPIQYLMIKFLCTRQDSAERLGVQGLSVLGYLRPLRDEPCRTMSCLQCRKTEDDTVCGTTLLLKTLHFIQQLAQDLVFSLFRVF